MNDLISRQAAIREYQKVCNGIKCSECPFLIKVNTEKGSHLITDCKLEAFLHNLPSAERHGRWILGGEIGWPKSTCSVCGGDGRGDYKVCPWCGASMDEVEE